MSRQPQLPPRCPISKTNFPIYDPSNQPRLQKTVSESFVFEEHPDWLDDLLGDCEPGLKLKSHRRASSDSGTVLDGLVEFEKDDKIGTSSSSSSSLESGCIYGPNSPRSKDKVSSIQETAIVSALSEYASHAPLQLDSVVQLQDSTDELNMEAKPFKRHSAQRSRVRKLLYIAELERTVEKFQNIVSELGIRVDSLVKQHVYLSVENKQLKHKLSRVQQEKFLMERQYQSMRNEIEGLKRYANSSKIKAHFRSNSAGDSEKLHTWHMIDMGKLQIN
ncbi:basic leucine zipper 6 [Lactuca sativa]|uniref:BZIP domain-containing protein n=1 Tax=Lactuca sativa TaxID=4236 RepID=A0A9R1WEJ6_LACSA|nr:basic leucine zipper 6 [Lactuca sativa]XP_023767707.1 basic leucine zipper 6 [Lactuca sativa]XP_023767708.1 basic leucine zipper 6 [Lactuca sativa]KAJ0221367.1 hypothetical protein LSAT_V11C200089160 [Lactuca sativa]